jgi:polysaccharide export outer membrane protein
MKTKFLHLMLLLTACLLLTNCASRRKVVYIQGAENLGGQTNPYDYNAKIQKDDQLVIVVNSKEPALAAPFNMQLTQSAFNGTTVSAGNGSGGTPVPFWVDKEGYIDYPTMGKVYVEGMTRSQLSDSIQNYLISTNLIADAIVSVRFSNHKYTVLGEVSSHGIYSMGSDRVTIFDAIAEAGDITIYGEHDKVRLLRNEDGKETVYTVNLLDPAVLTSPYYYIHQNDVLYVEPNSTKSSNREVSQLYTFALSILSTAISIATLVRTFSR